MRKIALIIILLVLSASIGYCQTNIKSECEDLLLWFQQEFETTADYGSSKTLAQRLDVRLNGLIEKYGRINVIKTVSNITEQDKRFISPVPKIILDRLKSKEEKSLVLTIKSDQSVYRIGEEIKLLVTLENNSDKEIIIFWPEGSPGMIRKEINVFTLLVNSGDASQPLYIKSKQGFEKYITLSLDARTGPALITLEYTPTKDLGFLFNPTTQMIWQKPLISSTIQIEVKGKESQKISPFLHCQKNEDCKAIINYCNCKQECLNKFTELENCPPGNCKFGFDTLICYCKDNQCVEGPRE